MKTTAIAITALLAAAVLMPVQPATGAVTSERAAATNCPEPLPSQVEWIKVTGTGCATGGKVTKKMRRYVADNPDAFDENGYYHKEIRGWACKARFIGTDAVLMGCSKRLASGEAGKIKAVFYIG